jgi:hypothetical protein
MQPASAPSSDPLVRPRWCVRRVQRASAPRWLLSAPQLSACAEPYAALEVCLAANDRDFRRCQVDLKKFRACSEAFQAARARARER